MPDVSADGRLTPRTRFCQSVPIIVVVVWIRVHRHHHLVVVVIVVVAMAMGLTCFDDRSLLPRRRSDSERESSLARRKPWKLLVLLVALAWVPRRGGALDARSLKIAAGPLLC